MQLGAKTGLPRQGWVFGIDERGIISRNRVVGLLGLNPEAPDLAFPRTVRVGLIDLVDSPIVSLAIYKAVRIRVSGEADNKIQRFLVAPECVTCAVVHIVKIISEVNIVRDGKITGGPRHAGPCLGNHSSVSRAGS